LVAAFTRYEHWTSGLREVGIAARHPAWANARRVICVAEGNFCPTPYSGTGAYEPAVIARDAEINAALREQGVLIESFNAALLHEPSTIRNQSGKPFQVFTPFGGTVLQSLILMRHCICPKTWSRRISGQSLWRLRSLNWNLASTGRKALAPRGNREKRALQPS
jgi:hypothetical protein